MDPKFLRNQVSRVFEGGIQHRHAGTLHVLTCILLLLQRHAKKHNVVKKD
jgi:hypothetical protein